MKLSVIIPVYNVVPYLRRCVESVLNQTYKEMEIILVDDGSTDESGELCDKIAEEGRLQIDDCKLQNDARIKVIHKQNGGVSDARNVGLEAATGEYVVFLDSDDYWLCADGVEQLMARLQQLQSDILLFKRVDIYSNRKIYAEDYDSEYIRSHSAQEVFENLVLSEHFKMSACFQIIRRELLIENNLLFPVGYISEDVDFSCRLWQYAQIVDALNIDMYAYCHRTNSISTSYSIRVLDSYNKMFTYWKEQIADQCVNHRAIGAFMANLYVSCSYNYFLIDKHERTQAKEILHAHKELLSFSASPKSQRMRRVVDTIGIKSAIRLFALYGKLKNDYLRLSQPNARGTSNQYHSRAMSTRHIVLIGPYPLSMDCIHGGVEGSVFGLAQELVRTGHTVDVLDYPRIGGDNRVEQQDSLTIHRYVNPGRRNISAIVRSRAMFQDIVSLHPDVVHIHGTGDLESKLFKAIQGSGIPMLLTVHGLLHEEKEQALRRKLSLKHLYQYIVQTNAERRVLNRATCVIVDTPYVERMIATYHQQGWITHLPEMHVIPQGIDSVYYTLRCNPYSRTILSVGGIGARKGHIYTVEMFNLLRARGIDAKLRIVGAMTSETYHALLLQKIADSPYRQDISLEVNLPREELFKAYQEAKLFVLHSREESQGIVFAEAMATGMPVVATNIGGIPYVAENGRSSLLCEYGDVEAMTEMVERLMTNQELWQAYSKHARQVAKQYNWTNIAEDINEIYKSIVQK